MPLVHVALRQGKPTLYRRAILDGIDGALRDTFDVPPDDRFMTITEHEAENFSYGSFPDMARGDDLLLIQITVSNTRSREKKQALYARIVERLADDPGVRPEDVFVNLVEVERENWSFGQGIAQYAVRSLVPPPGALAAVG